MLAVAPMLDWTDRHCRYFHRQMSRHVRLYTEMVTAPALIHGDLPRHLDYDPAEHPVALQLGGSTAAELAQAVTIALPWGYDEINLNVGCPSDRVQSGAFGACLMRDPAHVARLCTAMLDAAKGRVRITVKCRIGVDEQDPTQVLPDFLHHIAAAGIEHVIIHARKAWLKGLSPKENREIPPLDYPLVVAMKRAYPLLHISINGGITTLAQGRALMDQGLDGVMIGRAAYHDPAAILLRADEWLGQPGLARHRTEVVQAMYPYIAAHLARGGRLHQITRHMLGLFHGQPGGARWRRVLSTDGTARDAGLAVLDQALNTLEAAKG